MCVTDCILIKLVVKWYLKIIRWCFFVCVL